VGSNGVGKATLLSMVKGLVRPWAGYDHLSRPGCESYGGPCPGQCRLGPVPEGLQFFTEMTVAENWRWGPFPNGPAPPSAAILGKVFELFPRLKERAGQKSGTPSGREQQMVAVARGLLAEPEVLMLDELSLGLSPLLALTLFDTLNRLKKTGLTMLLVEQNVTMALAVSDYAYVLSQGKFWLESEARQLLTNDEVRRTYLGI
jgi:branched-chain amino acid transport system ATP-binding protein